MKKLSVKAGLLIGAAALSSCTKSEKEEAVKPNIVIIIADDLGFGDVSAYGAKTINTPNIDSIAHNGVTFTNAYASSATSTPSRYGMLTGMYPWKNKDAKILDGDAPLLINHEKFTLPKMMREAGYTTGAIGKWHLGMGNGNVNWNERITPGAPEVGFDYSCIAAATNDRVPTVYVENGEVLNLDSSDPIYVNYTENFEGEPSATANPELLRMQWSHGHNQAVINGIPRIGYMKGGQSARWVDEDMADFYVERAKEFIDAHAKEPFFLYFGLHQPHVPRTPHPRFVGTSGMGPRGDVIVEADWCVGQIMETLRKNNLLDNTIVIFTSDNGPVLDDGYVDQAAELLGEHKPMGPLRGGKYSLYDGGTHVPFFVYWRGHTVAGKVSDALVCQIDLAPSFADILGIEITDSIDGVPLMPALLGETTHGRDELVFEATGRTGLRSGDWALIPPYKGKERNLTGNELGNLSDYALFNVKSDPGQTTDLAAEQPEVLERLKARYEELTAVK